MRCKQINTVNVNLYLHSGLNKLNRTNTNTNTTHKHRKFDSAVHLKKIFQQIAL